MYFFGKTSSGAFEPPSSDKLDEEYMSILDCETWCGSMHYIAPEIIRARDTHERYSFPVDVYALGVTLYVMTSGVFPFSDANEADGEASSDKYFESVLAGAWSFDCGPHRNATHLLRSLISSMLLVLQVSRPSAEILLDHPWLSVFEKVPLCSPLSEREDLQSFSKTLQYEASTSIECSERFLLDVDF